MEIRIYGEDSPLSGGTSYVDALSGNTLFFNNLSASTLTGLTGLTVGGGFSASTLSGSGSNLSGVVNSVTTSTGISANTSSGNITLVNTSPDQTVTITAGSGVSVSGTYPSFTITNTSGGTTGTYYSSSSGTTGPLTGNTVATIYSASVITNPAAGTYLVSVTTDVTQPQGQAGSIPWLELSIFSGASQQTETIVRAQIDTNTSNFRIPISTHKILTVNGSTNVSFGIRTTTSQSLWRINTFVLTMVKIA